MPADTPRIASVLSALLLVLACAACKATTATNADLGADAPERAPYSTEPAQGLDSDAALARLKAGNTRYTAGEPQRGVRDAVRRDETSTSQSPFAIVLCCSDSRVAPEVIFDEGIGDLFVIRIAGNVLDDHAIGSIEYAAAHLHTPLIVVLGHERCGAVTAATAADHAEGHVDALVKAIRSHIGEGPHDDLDHAININAIGVAAELRASEPILKPLVDAGQLQVAAARYDLDTGAVKFLP